MDEQEHGQEVSESIDGLATQMTEASEASNANRHWHRRNGYGGSSPVGRDMPDSPDPLPDSLKRLADAAEREGKKKDGGRDEHER